MKKLLTTAALIGLGVLIAGNGAWGRSSSSTQILADKYKIDRIEKTWHKAASSKDVDLMMTLWAPKSTFTIAGKTYAGKKAIRQVFANAGPFQLQNNWESDTPAYKIRITVNGNKGTLYFECHYIDVVTQKVAAAVGADQDVQKINGRWLITKAVASSVTLKR
jgi:ketosteroid isomerase-like protein